MHAHRLGSKRAIDNLRVMSLKEHLLMPVKTGKPFDKEIGVKVLLQLCRLVASGEAKDTPIHVLNIIVVDRWKIFLVPLHDWDSTDQ